MTERAIEGRICGYKRIAVVSRVVIRKAVGGGIAKTAAY